MRKSAAEAIANHFMMEVKLTSGRVEEWYKTATPAAKSKARDRLAQLSIELHKLAAYLKDHDIRDRK